MRANLRFLAGAVVISSMATGCWEQFQGPATGQNGPAETVKPYAGVRMATATGGTVEAHQDQPVAELLGLSSSQSIAITFAGLDADSGVRSVNGYVHLDGICWPKSGSSFHVRQLIIRTFNANANLPRKVEGVQFTLNEAAMAPLFQQCSGVIQDIEGDVQVSVRDWKGNIQNDFVGYFTYVE